MLASPQNAGLSYWNETRAYDGASASTPAPGTRPSQEELTRTVADGAPTRPTVLYV
ncbi:hypothetical protein [Streptomyces sp. 3211]|uniref:hypothetical protein n=1 Tax=Streptomyces sp. 3211 TaxID=1964449 RepID=UPI001331898A|nr:hypothetical protein [Streptomyces sp. 3211]